MKTLIKHEVTSKLPIRYRHQLAMKIRSGVYTLDEAFELVMWLMQRQRGYK